MIQQLLTGFNAAGGGAPGTATWQSQGAVDYQALTFPTDTYTPSFPASIAAGDLLILTVGQKPQTANGGGVTTPVGWTLITSITGQGGYGSTLGADTGNMNIFAYYKVADGSESGTLNVSVTDSNTGWAVIDRLTKDSGTWNVAAMTVGDSSSGNVSLAFGSDPGVQANDFVIVGMAIPSNENATAVFSAPALSQTGATFGAVTETAEYHTNVNNDCTGATWRASVTAGTSAGNPTFSATAGGVTTNTRGAGVFIRVRAS